MTLPLYSPVEGRKEFIPQQLSAREPDLAMRQEKMRRMMEKMKKILSAEKIGAYVEEHLGDKSEMFASGLPLESAEDFIKIIYVRLYGQRKNMKYNIEPTEEKEVNGFRFKDFRIWRK